MVQNRKGRMEREIERFKNTQFSLDGHLSTPLCAVQRDRLNPLSCFLSGYSSGFKEFLIKSRSRGCEFCGKDRGISP